MSINHPIIEDFQRAVGKLKEILAIEKTEIVRDSAIKRFEICFDLAWKTIKIFAQKQGVECNSPRACFKSAFQLGLISYDEKWLAMIDDRNLAAHIYKEECAEQVYSRLKSHLGLFEALITSSLLS